MVDANGRELNEALDEESDAAGSHAQLSPLAASRSTAAGTVGGGASGGGASGGGASGGGAWARLRGKMKTVHAIAGGRDFGENWQDVAGTVCQ